MLLIKQLKRMLHLSVLIVILSGLTACVTTQTPKISHVHVGHAMTAWQDTPKQQGLFVIAEQEAIIAFEHAQYAVASAADLNELKMHIKHVQHAMDPGMSKEGPGLGYGFIKAISTARDHILFAADAKDASDNIKKSAELWAENVDVIIQRSKLVVALTKEIILSDSHEEVIVLTDEVELLTKQNLYGYDSDGDGIIGSVKDDYGIKQLKEEMQIMIEKEDPPYQTVEKKYLFGLIRLPSGEWTYDFYKKSSDNSSGFQY